MGHRLVQFWAQNIKMAGSYVDFKKVKFREYSPRGARARARTSMRGLVMCSLRHQNRGISSLLSRDGCRLSSRMPSGSCFHATPALVFAVASGGRELSSSPSPSPSSSEEEVDADDSEGTSSSACFPSSPSSKARPCWMRSSRSCAVAVVPRNAHALVLLLHLKTPRTRSRRPGTSGQRSLVTDGHVFPGFARLKNVRRRALALARLPHCSNWKLASRKTNRAHPHGKISPWNLSSKIPGDLEVRKSAWFAVTGPGVRAQWACQVVVSDTPRVVSDTFALVVVLHCSTCTCCRRCSSDPARRCGCCALCE